MLRSRLQILEDIDKLFFHYHPAKEGTIFRHVGPSVFSQGGVPLDVRVPPKPQPKPPLLSSYREGTPLPKTCSNLFDVDLSIQGPPFSHFQTCLTWTLPPMVHPALPSPDMFKLVHYVARTVGKRAVGICLNGFLYLLFLVERSSF